MPRQAEDASIAMNWPLDNSETRTWVSVKRTWPTSNRSQLVLVLVLLTLGGNILFPGPLGWPVAVVRPAFRNPPGPGGVLFLLAIWFICLNSPTPWRLTNSLGDNLRLVLTCYLLFVFLLSFLVECLTGSAVQWLQVHQSVNAQPWIQVLSSLSIAIGAAVVLPRLRNLKEGSVSVREEHIRFLAAAESTLDDFYIFDGIPDSSGEIVDFRFRYINPNAERRLNTQRESLAGKILTEARPFMVSSGLIEKYREVVRTGVPFTTEVFIDDDMIKATWLNVQVVKLGDGIAITSRDVTEHRRLADRIKYLAHHDQLTGLANRTLLQDRLQQAILRAQRHNHKVAILCWI